MTERQSIVRYLRFVAEDYRRRSLYDIGGHNLELAEALDILAFDVEGGADKRADEGAGQPALFDDER